ncbi:MAG: response regulator transcription factor [Sphingomonadaceae bacterium]
MSLWQCGDSGIGEVSETVNNERAVYVVDDDRMARSSLHFLLAAAGFDARPFASGQDFLDALGFLKPGCILLDLRMPAMDGQEVLQRMRSHLPMFPVVVITGHGDIASAVQCIKLGAADFIEKPFKDEQLFAILNPLFENLIHSVEAQQKKLLASQALSRLSPRQAEIFALLTKGHTSKQVGKALGLSPRTVDMHRAHILERLSVNSIAAAMSLLSIIGEEGLLSPDPAPSDA